MPGKHVHMIKQMKLKHYAPAVLKETDMEVKSSEITLEVEEGSQDVLVRTSTCLAIPTCAIASLGLDYSHHPSFNIGQLLEGFGVSEVAESANPNLKPGACVSSWTKWEEYSVIPKGERLKIIDPSFAPLLTTSLQPVVVMMCCFFCCT
ncbi:hypothetical protein KC19_9G121900 [Ceratodon purpureus]|uniref:Oxidoreductase N-terminal domain-containing protein n=1 Tax=Ceratodon purpureus TaxID=3225 RepID=A0A8T0GVI8_CERPU|nr:hypothetical protein KC19_9G121900 [Ceratodon purpureus]